jgi:hypothetical protein
MIVIGGWGYTNQKPITIMEIRAGAGKSGAREYGVGHAEGQGSQLT